MKYFDAIQKGKGVQTNKAKFYFETYDFHFQNLDRNASLNILEIGVQNGGGVNALRNYFPHSKIYGVDIDPNCKRHEDDNIEIFIGNQGDVNFLESIKKKVGNFDLIVDDGSHQMNDMQISFEVLFPILNGGGIYLIEDLGTCYWPSHGGGRNNEDNTIEVFKRIVDRPTSSWASRCERAGNERTSEPVDYYDSWIKSIHFHDSILVVYKYHEKRTNFEYPNYEWF